MRPMNRTSTLEVLTDGMWVGCILNQLDEGDVFRLRKVDGKLHEDKEGNNTWICTKIPMIVCEPKDPMTKPTYQQNLNLKQSSDEGKVMRSVTRLDDHMHMPVSRWRQRFLNWWYER